MSSAFEVACRTSFQPLVTRFGFSEPEMQRIGREYYLRYHKGEKTVSVACELGSPPIVELFFPAGPTDEVTPWAARGETPYSRRIPRLGVQPPKDISSTEGLFQYLGESMSQLAKLEESFLAV